MVAAIGGMVILGINIYHFIQLAQKGHTKFITALGINIAVLIVYAGYFCTGLYCVIIFSRIVKNPRMISSANQVNTYIHFSYHCVLLFKCGIPFTDTIVLHGLLFLHSYIYIFILIVKMFLKL